MSKTLSQPWVFVFAGWRRLMRTLTMDFRLAAIAVARIARRAAAATMKAVARIGEGMVIGISFQIGPFGAVTAPWGGRIVSFPHHCGSAIKIRRR